MTVAFKSRELIIHRPDFVSKASTEAPARSPIGRQLLIDVSTIAQFDARTGIQRVVRAIATALQKISFPGASVRLVAASRTSFYRVLPDNWLQRPADSRLDLAALPPVSVRAGDIFFGLDFSTSILPQHERQIAQWRRDGVSINIVLYDLLPLSDRRWFTFRMQNNFRRWLKFTERHADHVIAISKTVAGQFRSWQVRTRLSRARRVPISVARLGSDISASLPSRGLPSDSKRILQWMNRNPTILMVGTIEPRKGYDQALDAFRLLWSRSEPVQLIIIGRGGWKTARLQARLRETAAADDRLVWLEGPSDEFLEQIYQRANGLLVASNGEGFGLPIVEGLSHGLPVLVRDLPVFRELQGDGVTFFESKSSAELANAIATWHRSSACSGTPAARRTHSWEEAASDIMNLLLADASASSHRQQEIPDG